MVTNKAKAFQFWDISCSIEKVHYDKCLPAMDFNYLCPSLFDSHKNQQHYHKTGTVKKQWSTSIEVVGKKVFFSV